MTSNNPFADPDFVRRTLAGFAQQVARLATAFTPLPASHGPAADAWRAPLLAAYQQAFSAPGLGSAGPGASPSVAGADWARWAKAGERLAALTSRIAGDAFERLSRALADDSPGAAPISTLAGLHALWVECGDAAWLEGAGREDFAEAQADWLSALAALRAAARP
jgi:hypothetical protein